MKKIHRQHGYGVVLLLVLASAAFQVAAGDSDWSRMATILLGAAILSASVWAARAQHVVVRAAVVAAVLLALASIAVLLITGEVPKASAALVNGLLVAIAPAVIVSGLLRDVRSEGAVTMRTLAGVLAIYLLLGMFFSFIDGAVAVLDGGPFFAGVSSPTRSDFLYFSYVTLSTVGYGDLSPVNEVGRMLAITESLIGQIYLVSVVGVIVANLRPRARETSDTAGL